MLIPNILRVAFLGFLVSHGLAHGEEGKHLFILSGQSNMANLKPEKAFTPAVTKALRAGNVMVVKDAKSGAAIKNWILPEEAAGSEKKKGGGLYVRLMEKVKPVMESEQDFATVTFLWMQGESDAKGGGGSYEEKFMTVLGQLKRDLGRDDLMVVIARISDHGIKHNEEASKKYEGWTAVRAAQVKMAEESPRIEWFDTDDLNDKKNDDGTVRHDVHYSGEGYRKLGERFAEKAIALVKASEAK